MAATECNGKQCPHCNRWYRELTGHQGQCHQRPAAILSPLPVINTLGELEAAFTQLSSSQADENGLLHALAMARVRVPHGDTVTVDTGRNIIADAASASLMIIAEPAICDALDAAMSNAPTRALVLAALFSPQLAPAPGPAADLTELRQQAETEWDNLVASADRGAARAAWHRRFLLPYSHTGARPPAPLIPIDQQRLQDYATAVDTLDKCMADPITCRRILDTCYSAEVLSALIETCDDCHSLPDSALCPACEARRADTERQPLVGEAQRPSPAAAARATAEESWCQADRDAARYTFIHSLTTAYRHSGVPIPTDAVTTLAHTLGRCLVVFQIGATDVTTGLTPFTTHVANGQARQTDNPAVFLKHANGNFHLMRERGAARERASRRGSSRVTLSLEHYTITSAPDFPQLDALRALLADIPRGILHRPHTLRPSIIVRVGSGSCTTYLRVLTKLAAVWAAYKTAVEHDDMPGPGNVQANPDPADAVQLSALDLALIMRHLFPTLMLQQPAPGSGAEGTTAELRWRCDQWERGSWAALFLAAGLRNANHEWTLGQPEKSAPSPSGDVDEFDHLVADDAGAAAASRSFGSVVRHARDGQLGCARQALHASSFVDPSACAPDIRRLHPQRRQPATVRPRPAHLPRVIPRDADNPVASDAHCRRAIVTAPYWKGHGPNLYRYEHFKLALCKLPSFSVVAQRLLTALTFAMQQEIAGQLPAWFRACYTSGTLHLLAKTAGGVRPVGVGNADRRLTSRALVIARLPFWEKELPHDQVAVGVAAGAEGVALMTRQGLADGLHSQSFDEINAFNEIDRQEILDETEVQAPEEMPYVGYLYGGDMELFSASASSPQGYITTRSSDGVQQGCALAMMLFARGLARGTRAADAAFQECAARHPATLARPGVATRAYDRPFLRGTYADDLFSVATPTMTRLIHALLPAFVWVFCGLRMAAHKGWIYPPLPPTTNAEDAVISSCVALHMPTEDQLEADSRPACNRVGLHFPIPLPPPHAQTAPGSGIADMSVGVKVLGVSIGPPAWEATEARRVLSSVLREDSDALLAFTRSGTPLSLQIANLVWTRAIFARAVYLLRSAPPIATRAASVEFDAAARTTLATIYHLPRAALTDPAHTISRRAALRTSLGGLEWTLAQDIVDAASLAGVTDAARVAIRLTSHAGVLPSFQLDAIPFFRELGIQETFRRVASQLRNFDLDAASVSDRANIAAGDEAPSVATLRKSIAVALHKPLPVESRIQHFVSDLQQNAAQKSLLAEMDVADEQQAAHLRSMAMPGPAAIFVGIPATDDAGLCLANELFSIELHRQLYVGDVFPPHLQGALCPFCGSETLDNFGSHVLVCKSGPHGRVEMHDHITDCLIQAHRAAGLSARRAVVTDTATDDGRMVDAIAEFLHRPDEGSPSTGTRMYDVRGVHAETPGLLARMATADAHKRAKHSAGCSRMGGTFYPFVYALSGALSDTARAVLKDLSAAAASQADPQLFLSYWLLRMSFQIRGDCARRILAATRASRLAAHPHASHLGAAAHGFALTVHAASLRGWTESSGGRSAARALAARRGPLPHNPRSVGGGV